ncbi:hypothetical protein ACIQZO_05490 [Streptomyces sp. NPDC097617]
MLDGRGQQQSAVVVGAGGGFVEDVVAEIGDGRAEPPVPGRPGMV